MFNGLIRELAKVESFDGKVLKIKSNYNPKIGDSIAINGACLTIIESAKNYFSVELSIESQSILALENYKELVHIEPAMKLSDRIDGHLIQGHIDCLGVITKIIKNEDSNDFFITIPKEFIKFVIPKGSIAIDGISLTVNEVYENSFRLTIIPHTMQNSLFKYYKINQRVNIETDMFARYVYHLFAPKEKKAMWSEIDKIMAIY
jgi:riboflavin synthase